ncbi:MAG TPA: hypothetical protein VNB22_03190 [Pyrinomonadaceae bacterium]|nr:hypothetical protein [Pyrinomonadaceae bacterium]
MVYKVDGGGVSSSRREEPVIKKPEVKPAFIRNENPQTNAAVYTNRSESSNQANVLRFKLNAQFVAPARQTTPTITPQEAQTRADEIIKNNGGKDNLNTEGVGRDLAAIAKTNPADARTITEAMLGDSIDQDGKGKIKEEDKDEIAQSFTNNLNDTELDTVARDENGRALLERMQRHLLSGSVHSDETATAERIQAAVGKYQTFSEFNQGIDRLSDLAMTTPYGAAFDPNSSPEEAAAALKSPFKPNYDPQSDVQAFTDQLEAHKNDPQWLRSYYAALGSDKTAELISNAATSSGYSTYLYGGYGSKDAAEMYNKNMDIIGDSLETLRASGGLSQTDMNNLVGAMVDHGFNPNVGIDMFGKASPEVKEMFVRASVADGNDTVEAAGSLVLSQMSGDKQAQILGSLSDEQLNNFIEGAMAGQTEAIDMSNYLSTGIADKTTTLGGVQRLLSTANQYTGYYGSTFQTAPFSPELQNRVFNAAVNGLNNSKAFDNFRENPAFKDELSKLFINNGAEILKGQAPDGAFQNADFITGMTKFFELTLFSPKGGELRDELMSSVVKTMGNVGDASKNPPLSQSEYENLHNGWSQQDHTEVMGGLLGMVWQAAENQKEFIQNDIMQDAAKKKEMVGFFVGMAFSFVPGAGDVMGKIAGEGASFLQQIPDKIVNFAWDQSKDQLKNGSQDFLLNLLKGSSNSDALANVDMLTDKFRDIIVATNAALPNGEAGELNLRSAFQSAFSFYHELVEFN